MERICESCQFHKKIFDWVLDTPLSVLKLSEKVIDISEEIAASKKVKKELKKWRKDDSN